MMQMRQPTNDFALEDDVARVSQKKRNYLRLMLKAIFQNLSLLLAQ